VRIKDLPKEERPREKALKYGVDTLSNIEVLALIIGSGIKGCSALDIAALLISSSRGLHLLKESSVDKLRKTSGMSVASSLRLAAAFELSARVEKARADAEKAPFSTKGILEKYKEEFTTAHQENLIIIMLNHRGEIIAEKRMYKGTKDNFPISVSEIMSELLINRCSSYVVLHNHPNGDLVPSDDDLISTKVLLEEAQKLRIKMRDHIIISDRGYYSFLENGLINNR